MKLIELVPKRSPHEDAERRLKELEKRIRMRLEEIRAKGKGMKLVEEKDWQGEDGLKLDLGI